MSEPPEPSGPKFSSNLLRLKFMQKAQDKRKTVEDARAEQAKLDESKWTANSGDTKGCKVIVERDPLPAALCGRMSFQSFNPGTERLQAELDAQSTGKGAGVSVTDQEMAEVLKKPDPDEVVPLRPSKKKKAS